MKHSNQIRAFKHMKEMIMFLFLLSSQVFKLVIGASLFPFHSVKYHFGNTELIRLYRYTGQQQYSQFTIHREHDTIYQVRRSCVLGTIVQAYNIFIMITFRPTAAPPTPPPPSLPAMSLILTGLLVNLL